MKKILSLILAFASIVASLVVFTSCGEPKDGGPEISVYLGESVYDFDPSDYYIDDNAAQIMSLIFEPLFTLDKKGKLTMDGAAEDYEVDEENRKITISLRESYWSDGVQLTAEHFIYAWRQLLMEPTDVNPAAALLYDIENAVAIKNGEMSIYEFGAIADVFDIIITYREGADYEQLLKNLSSVATAPIREDIALTAPGYWTKGTANIVTNGPFKVQRLDYATCEFSLARNSGYHQKLTAKDYTATVNPGELISFFGTNGKMQTLSYKDIEDKVIFYMGDASLADRKANKDEAEVIDALSTYTYVFDTTNPLFAKKEVRKALSLAIDRAKIIDEITFGKAATGFLPATASGNIYSKKVVQSLIAAEAKKTEAENLLKGVDFTGLNKKFTLTVNDDEQSKKIAELVANSWNELGFTVTVKPVSTVSSTVTDKTTGEKITIKDSAIQTLAIKAAKGDIQFDVIGLDWQMYSTDAFVALSAFATKYSGNGIDFATGTARKNISGWSSESYDKLIAEAYAAATAEERATKLREAEALLVDESPVVPVIFNQNFAFVSKALSKVNESANGFFVFTDTKQKNYRDYLEKED